MCTARASRPRRWPRSHLTLVIAEAVGHDPIKATGLLLAHIGRICEQTDPGRPQLWRLRTSTKPSDKPWDYVERLARRREESARDLYERERLTEAQLRRRPLGPTP